MKLSKVRKSTSSSCLSVFFFPLLLFSDVLFPPLELDSSEVTSWRKFFKMSPEGKKLLNIIILGFGFMFMFTAFQTCGNIEVGVAIHNPDQSHTTPDKIHQPSF